MPKRKGKITRPAGATEPMIRLVGTAEQFIVEGQEVIEIPHVPPSWKEVLYGMFGECHDTPLHRAGGELYVYVHKSKKPLKQVEFDDTDDTDNHGCGSICAI